MLTSRYSLERQVYNCILELPENKQNSQKAIFLIKTLRLSTNKLIKFVTMSCSKRYQNPPFPKSTNQPRTVNPGMGVELSGELLSREHCDVPQVRHGRLIILMLLQGGKEPIQQGVRVGRIRRIPVSFLRRSLRLSFGRRFRGLHGWKN